MKTPEQIAEQMLDTHFRGVRTEFQDQGLTEWMVRAIKADRAQRCAHDDVIEDGTEPDGAQIYLCHGCGERWNGGAA